MKAQTPSGGDSLAFGQAVDMSTRANSQHIGFVRLWQGTPDVRTCMVVDRGYIPNLRGIGANITTVRQFCEDNNILLLTPAKQGEASLSYDPVEHLFSWQENITDEVI